MLLLFILAYTVSAFAIATYLYLAVTGDAHPFNIVNACGWPVFFASIAVGAYPAAILNLFFTLVGTIGLLQDRRQRKAEAESTYTAVLDELSNLEKHDDGTLTADLKLFGDDVPTVSVPWRGGQNGKN